MPWRWPALRLRPALALLGVAVVFGAWSGNTVALAMRGDGSDTPWTQPMLWELSGSLAAWVCLPIPFTAAANAPRGRWLRFALIHLVCLVAFSGAKLVLMVGARHLLYPLLGWGTYDYGPLGWRIPMEVQKDVLAYLVFLAALEAWRLWRERQRIEENLREARLHALAGQLGPHFLFNALNTVSSVMYEDLARTDRLLADLGILLRASFERGAPSWPLAEERAYTERYLRLVQARFGDRIVARWDLDDPALADAQVPRFALQLLVENAIKHNQDRAEPLTIRIEARRDGQDARVVVEDDGRGFSPAATTDAASKAADAADASSTTGTGLRHLTHSLELLFGPRASLTRGAGAQGGARVTLRVPVQT